MPQVNIPTEQNKSDGVPERKPSYEIKDMYYNMNYSHRGMALIFNHEHYQDPDLKPRSGTNEDRDKLDAVLSDLGFEVKIKNNLTSYNIFKTIKEVAKMDHSQNDCLLIAVLTHGEFGKLHAKDTYYSIRNLWRYFIDKRCPTLAGKPKIFIIQACRGDKYDDGCTLSDNLETEGLSTSRMYEIRNNADLPTALNENINHPDFLFAYSTAPGYYSWRNSTNGTWFIQTLCAVLTDYASKENIMALLTLVCCQVAVDFESYTHNDVTSKKKQIPTICSTLTRLLVFNKKEE